MPEEQNNTIQQPADFCTTDQSPKLASPGVVSIAKPGLSRHLQAPEEKTLHVLKKANQYDREHTSSSSLWEKVFPNKEARKVELMRCKTIQEKYEFELRVLQTFHDAQMQFIQEKYQSFLVEEKAKVRKERAIFFQEQLDELTSLMSQKNREFLKNIHEEYQALEEIPLEKLRKKQEEFIEKSIDRYYDVVTHLIEQFQKILNEEVNRKK